jgi:glucose/arabinose dehydrogenase
LIVALRDALALAAGLAMAPAAGAMAATVPGGFQDSVILSGLNQPTTVAFAPDGRIFVAEKSGLVKVFDGPGDTTATIFADLRTKVHDFWDRGMAGLALHPNFPTTPYVYVTYTLDAPIGGTPPVWNDGCPTPPGPTGDGCVVGGRLSRLQANGDVMSGPEQVLIEAWCQQFPSHSVDGVIFGGDGALYVSAGEGANFTGPDYGQFGTPLNPCGDPPAGVGGMQTPPSAEGGALRAQSPRRLPGEAAVLNGTVLRLDPITGQALPDNPFVGSGIPNAERIIAYGLRNPFRLAPRPGTNEIWVGDVGWNAWDEIDRIADAGDATIENFGWPCYEGLAQQESFRAVNLDQCRTLYQQAGIVTAPFFSYRIGQSINGGEDCGTGGNTISGLAFYGGGSYPTLFDEALFFSDYSRGCIWAMLPGGDGEPDPNQRVTFATQVNTPVDLKIGPQGDLFYVSFNAGQVRRVQFFGNGQPPLAVIASDVQNGQLPLTVHFDGGGSSDPDSGSPLTYAWDLDGDGQFDDSTAVAPQFTYTQAGTVNVRLRVTDVQGLSTTAALAITPGNSAPTATITAPLATTQWQVGSIITFAGSATDPEEGLLPAVRLSWAIIMHHCSQESCHLHPVQEYVFISGGSFTAPNHEYPSFLEIRLTARDSGGLSDTRSVFIQPRTVSLTFQSGPSGLALAVGSESLATPFTKTVIVGSTNTVSAPSPQSLAGASYGFTSWSDGGAISHSFVAGSLPATLVATFTCASGCGPIPTPEPPHQLNGVLQYYRGARPVGGAAVDLLGSSSVTASSGSAGQYGFSNLVGGTWQVAARKAGDRRGAVSALDAAYVLQAIAGRRVFDAQQTLAADGNGDGVISMVDAVRILELSVGGLAQLPSAQLCGSDWLFAPAPAGAPNQTLLQPAFAGGGCVRGAITYSPLAGDPTGQNFQAILLGDPTGNWRPAP